MRTWDVVKRCISNSSKQQIVPWGARDLVWEGSEWKRKLSFHFVSFRIVWLFQPYIRVTLFFKCQHVFMLICYLEISPVYVFAFKRNLIGITLLLIKGYVTNCWWRYLGDVGPGRVFTFYTIYFHDIWTTFSSFFLSVSMSLSACLSVCLSASRLQAWL